VRQARSAIEYRQQLVAIKALVQDNQRTAQDRLDDLASWLRTSGTGHRQVTQPAYAKRSPTIITAFAICSGRYVS